MVDINKLAWMSYFREFSWSKIKKKGWTLISGSLIYLYIVFSYPSIFMDLKGVEYLLYLSGAISMTITAWTMQYSGIRLPKLMFMGPMSEEDRRCYLQKVWDIRFWLPNLLMIAVMGIRALFQPESILFGLLILLQNLLLSTGVMYTGIMSEIKIKEMQKVSIHIWQWLLGLFGEIILLYYYASETDSMMKGMMITWGVLLVIQLLNLRKLLPYKQKIFDFIVDYENAYVMQDAKGVKTI